MCGALEWLLARREKPNHGVFSERVCCRLGYDQVRDVHGVKRSPEQRVHAAQEGVEGVAGVALESAAPAEGGQLRPSPVAFG